MRVTRQLRRGRLLHGRGQLPAPVRGGRGRGHLGQGAGTAWVGHYCSAVGSYVDAAGRRTVLADSETGGVWATAAALAASAITSIPNFTANSVSCASPGNCVAGGYFSDEGNDEYAFTVTQTGGKVGNGAVAVRRGRHVRPRV